MIPADIDTIEFKTTRVKEGYDPTQVDNFLDRIRDSWIADNATARSTEAEAERLRKENERLKRQLNEANAHLAGYEVTAPIPQPAPAESATRILEFAQKTADDVTGAARAEAADIVGKARSEAYAVERELKNFERKRDEVKAQLRDFHRKHLNELEETGG